MSVVLRMSARAAASAVTHSSGESAAPVKITTEMKGSKFLTRLLGGDQKQIPLELIRDASEDVAKEWKRLAINNARAGRGRFTLSSRSGGLVKSIRYRSRATSKGKELDLQFHWIGAVHQSGAIITPKRAQYLVFYIPGVGWRKSKRVVIPSRPWASTALQQAQKQFPEFIGKRLRAQMSQGASLVKL